MSILISRKLPYAGAYNKCPNVISDPVALLLPATRQRLGKQPGTTSYTPTNVRSTPFGPALGKDSNSWSFMQEAVNINNAGAITVLAVAWSDIISNTERLPASLGHLSNATSFAITFGTGSASKVRQRAYLGGTQYIGGTFDVPTKPTVIVTRHKPGKQDLWVGGVKDPVTGSNNNTSVGLNFFGAYYNLAGDYVQLSAVFDRFLTDDEVIRYSRNPELLFEINSRPIWIPVTAGGGPASITGTLSSTLGDITSNLIGSHGQSGSLSVSLGDVTSNLTGSLGHSGNLTGSLDDISVSFTGSVATAGNVSGTMSVSLSDISSDFSGGLGHTGAISTNLADITSSFAGTVSSPAQNITGTLTGSLGDISVSIGGASGTLTLTQADIDAITTALITNPRTLTVPKFMGLK